MRIFELALVFISFSFLVIGFKKEKTEFNYRLLVIFIIATLFAFHIIFESVRWPMYGAYYLSLFLVLNLFFTLNKGWKKTLIFTFNIIIVLLTLIILFFFRVNAVPEFTGKYNVGTLTYDLVDENRIEIYGDTPPTNRKIRVQAWYPTDDSTGELVPWIMDGQFVAEQIPEFVYMPSFLMNYITVIDSNSFKDATLSDEVNKLPVIILSHGWYSLRNLHTDFAEMLASNGYLVLGIDHTYGAMGTVFADGTEVKVNPNALPSLEDHEEYLRYANTLVKTYYLDAQLVIDDLANLNSGQSDMTQFKDRIDMDKIGAIGHSTGGGGVVELSINDPRVKAVFGFDAWVEPLSQDVVSQGLSVPAILIRSNQWFDGPNNVNLKTIYDNTGSNLSIYQINGSMHQDFSMLYMFDPIIRVLGLSTMDIDLSREIQNTYLLEFFDKNLKGLSTNVDDLVNTYEEVVKVDFK